MTDWTETVTPLSIRRIFFEVVAREKNCQIQSFRWWWLHETNFDRPAISEALRLVENGQVSNFIVKDLSRLGRSYIKVGQLTEITFPSFDVRFIALNDGIDSNKPNETNSIFLPIKSLMDEMYARTPVRRFGLYFKPRQKRVRLSRLTYLTAIQKTQATLKLDNRPCCQRSCETDFSRS